LRLIATAVAAGLASMAAAASAGEADVLDARATRMGDAWRFDVTVRHSDTGWDHYADAWRIVGPDGTVHGVRILYHPHVGEQPFTRSLAGVSIPADVTSVVIEAHDSVDGWGGRTATVVLPR